ncbi:hypothetical protein AKJ41_00615 [candidate division MSBL1 archaeon SCGC-AAA259O05]|uniref:Transcription elongation factor Spt5 n=1 Tax=candidate division MSBL1 archaeon SCGC-AAA259O05 TaxID=1698271 RepID=A0A133V5H5_9EURY|nr:hypothetical protein AKJ41_00615 [candidate division MSBL1 archaeon SCGC-AAA259O05]
MAAKMMRARARSGEHPVYSIVVPGEMKGYLFVEAEGIGPVKGVTRGVRPVKSVMSDPATPDELEGLLKPGVRISGIKEGDRVEIVEGGLKGMEGEVAEVNPEREEVVIEVDDPAVPAPLTVAVEGVERK